MIDWSLARQIARLAAGPGEESPAIDLEVRRLAEEHQRHVAAYTGLSLAGPLPPATGIDRVEWADANLDMLAGLLEPVAARLGETAAGAGPLAPVLRRGAGLALAAEAGLVMGYLSTRVLGQYELSLLQPEAPARLLFVTPNLERAIEELSLDADSFLAWIVLHELTHVFEFSGVPWLRGHLAGLVSEYLDTVEVRVTRAAAAGLPALPDPQKLLAAFREGGLAALVQTSEQRDVLDRIQATMAMVEGYSEHVMDVVGSRVLPGYDGLREAMEQRRSSRSAAERVLQRLLGLDLKLRQYELGKRFCDDVAERGGVEALNVAWRSPAALPFLSELEDAGAWSERVRRDHPPELFRAAQG